MTSSRRTSAATSAAARDIIVAHTEHAKATMRGGIEKRRVMNGLVVGVPGSQEVPR